MDERTVKFEIGEMVRWYDTYSDLLITKDTGYGIIMDIQATDYGFTSGPWVTYRVYRNKHQDVCIFEIAQIEKLKDTK